MQPGGRKFFAGPTFANQQDRPLDGRNPGKPFLKLEKGFGLAERFCRSAWPCFIAIRHDEVYLTIF
jgi:hypothetical protein